MIFPARIKNGMAIRQKESIPPNTLMIATEKGISRIARNVNDVIRVARKTGSPKKIKLINMKKIRKT